MTSNWKYLAAGAAVIAVGATAALAGSLHTLTVNLPGGGTETIAYAGDVAPKVNFLTPDMVRDRESLRAWSPFADMQRASMMMDAMAADMDRQMQAGMLRARAMQQQMIAPGMTDAAFGPAGTQSYSVTTISNGQAVCTREVRITSAGLKPQMVSSSSGCGDDAAAAANAPKTTAIKTLIDANPAPRKRI